jgi:hypothetical protein
MWLLLSWGDGGEGVRVDGYEGVRVRNFEFLTPDSQLLNFELSEWVMEGEEALGFDRESVE